MLFFESIARIPITQPQYQVGLFLLIGLLVGKELLPYLPFSPERRAMRILNGVIVIFLLFFGLYVLRRISWIMLTLL